MGQVGRPLKFKSVEELQAKIDAYFNDTPKDEWTITGLALALDTSRKVLVEYEDKDEFSNAVKKAKLIVENGYEIDLKKAGRSGTIFALKNFDWRDKTEQDVNVRELPQPIIDVHTDDSNQANKPTEETN
ncbi:DNA-packaging protein [Candidatus Dojkabacteria bacterium]|jgi:hypothetical protein|nr:DNA-packaging protein [Candidatus Dojkabacteria bacterium]